MSEGQHQIREDLRFSEGPNGIHAGILIYAT
jgi:hypothetical protein